MQSTKQQEIMHFFNNND